MFYHISLNLHAFTTQTKARKSLARKIVVNELKGSQMVKKQ